jgi:hypothetical protein
MNFVGNYYKEGPNSTNDNAFREQCTYSSAYFHDNWMNDVSPRDPWSLVRFDGFTPTESEVYKQSSPVPAPLVEMDDARTAYELVLVDAGATFPERDEVDARVIDDVINGTGGIIDDEAEVGGWPELTSVEPPADTDDDGMPDEWESARCLDPDEPSDANGDRNGDGYTNIEEYINWIPLAEPMPTRHKTDLNCDDIVNLYDFAEFAEHYSSSSATALYDEKCDFDSDNLISLEDLLYIAQDWLFEY